MAKYWEKPYLGDVAIGSTVIVLFTARKVDVPTPVRVARGMPPVEFGIYFDVLAIIVLAEPTGQRALVAPQEAPDDLGVFSVRELSDWGE